MKYKYKVGDKAIVYRQICGHQFELGSIVTIVEFSSNGDYFQANDGKNIWYVSKDEIFPYDLLKNKILEELRNGECAYS